MDGFAIHGRYWARDEPRHLEGLLREWLPLAPGTPASPRAAQQPDGVHP